MSINGWMDQPDVVQAHIRVLFSLKKERNSDTCYIMDEL